MRNFFNFCKVKLNRRSLIKKKNLGKAGKIRAVNKKKDEEIQNYKKKTREKMEKSKKDEENKKLLEENRVVEKTKIISKKKLKLLKTERKKE